MSQLIEQLQALAADRFSSEDGEHYQAKLLPGLSEVEAAEFATQLPQHVLPGDIKQLLLFARGFELEGLGEVRFDSFGEFGLLGLFPRCIELANDGFGNYWLLDVSTDGQWGAVFFVCHDPQVIVRQSNNLLDFLGHVREFGKVGTESWLDQVHEGVTTEIWRQRQTLSPLISPESVRSSSDEVLRHFALNLPDNYLLADLRLGARTKGFAYNKATLLPDKISKHETEPIWGFEILLPKQHWLKRLFG
jgi:hypothetical protein